VDHKLKLILGLIWTLILHYDIAMPVWDDVDAAQRADTAAGDGSAHNLTPKQRLLAWIQNKIPDPAITNFTGDWRDGRAIGALVDGVAPGWKQSLLPVCPSVCLSVCTLSCAPFELLFFFRVC